MDARAAREPLLSGPFVLCALSNLFQSIAFNLFLHFPAFLEGLGADAVEIGWIFSVTAAVSIGLRPSVGRLMDTRGRRLVILVGHVLNVVVLALYLTIDAIGPWIYVVRIGHGLSEALLFTSLFTYAADHVPESRRTEGLALFGVSGMLPISLGGLLGDVILARAGFAELFGAAWLLAVVALLFALPLRDAPRRGDHGEPARGFLASLGQPDLLPMWWIVTVFSTALAALFAFLKLFVMETGEGSVTGFTAGYTAIALFLRVFVGWLPDRVGPKRVLLPALLVLASGFLLLSRADSALEVGLAGVLCGMGHGYTFPIVFGMVVTRARESERGSAMAIYTGIFDLGVLVGGPVFGLLIEVSGFATMYATVAAMLATGALVFAVWDRSRP